MCDEIKDPFDLNDIFPKDKQLPKNDINPNKHLPSKILRQQLNKTRNSLVCQKSHHKFIRDLTTN